ncbi:MAG: hypothetical protein ACLQNE_40640 [Thermoguttaceae bacterium]|jgi:hypothetical protein
MRNKTLRPGAPLTPDHGDLPFAFAEEAFERFTEQMDEALEGLVARWIARAAPASLARQRSSYAAGR